MFNENTEGKLDPRTFLKKLKTFSAKPEEIDIFASFELSGPKLCIMEYL